MVPDVRASCRPLALAARRLLEVLGRRLPSPAPARELAEFLAHRAEEIEAALDQPRGAPSTARRRLALERAVRRLSIELDAALDLVDVLAEATSGRPSYFDLSDVLRDSVAATHRVGARAIQVGLTAPAHHLALNVNPHVATAMFTAAVDLVAAPGRRPHVRVERVGTECRVSVREGGGDGGKPLRVIAVPTIAPTIPCLCAVAALMGARFDVGAANSVVEIVWRMYRDGPEA